MSFTLNGSERAAFAQPRYRERFAVPVAVLSGVLWFGEWYLLWC
jgi:hypothetical protein